MKITLRLILSLLFVATLVAGTFSYVQVRTERQRLREELERRTILLADSLRDSAEAALKSGDRNKLRKLVERFGNRERLRGVVIYDFKGQVLAASSELSEDAFRWLSEAQTSVQEHRTITIYGRLYRENIHLYLAPISEGEKTLGVLALLHNTDYIAHALKRIWQTNFVRLLILAILIVITTLLVVRWSITGPIAQLAEWLKGLRLGEKQDPLTLPRGDVLGPLASEVKHLAKSLAAARAAAEKEARLRLEAESIWTPEKLKEHVRSKLGEKPLFLISNREPYMHVKQKRKIECIVPASGLVTALEPVMRACGGIWIAHGSGDGDRETVDHFNKVKVPPNEPAYTLKRVWLTKEEENGHYYGFSNEGLWPLCHITHTRPTFRLEDWVYYQKVNQKFADSLLEEIEQEESPLVLIQDYHFALLPLLIREKRPDARTAVFWHIPWPNPESFGICPWKQELLLGMLGADLLGFHIQFHCNNFLDTVDHTLESKINWENFSIERGGHITVVRPYPISVANFPSNILPPKTEEHSIDKNQLKESLLKDYGISAAYLGVGVDRLDYTKGIIERFRAIGRFLEKYPEYVGKFTFVELGAPSRTHIQKYHDFIAEVEKTAEEVNWKFQTKEWKPILLLKAHHSHREIVPFYCASDLCLVTSLHDGMNLVAKEFISAREDEDGVLILSEFTGASRELKDAIIVNPYDMEETADAIRSALEMPQEERKRRMKEMRRIVEDRNVYRWAANIIGAITQLPVQERRIEQKEEEGL